MMLQDSEETKLAGARKKMRLIFLFRQNSTFTFIPLLFIYYNTCLLFPVLTVLLTVNPPPPKDSLRVFKEPGEPFISGAALEGIVHITNKYYLTEEAKHAVFEQVHHDGDHDDYE